MLREHPAIIERVKYSQLGIITEQLMAEVLQLETVLVGEAGSNTAKEGQTDSLSYIWGKNAIVAYIAKQIRVKMITFGITFTYSVRTVTRWRDEDRKGTYVRIGGDNYAQQIVAVNAAYLIANAIA